MLSLGIFGSSTLVFGAIFAFSHSPSKHTPMDVFWATAKGNNRLLIMILVPAGLVNGGPELLAKFQ